MKTFYICCVALLLSSVTLFAQKPHRVPAAPYPIEIVQSDGAELTIRLHGDENMHFTTTTDGYVIVEKEENLYYFGKVNCKGEIVASRYRAANEGNRTKKVEKYLKKMAKDQRLKRDVFVY